MNPECQYSHLSIVHDLKIDPILRCVLIARNAKFGQKLGISRVTFAQSSLLFDQYILKNKDCLTKSDLSNTAYACLIASMKLNNCQLPQY